MKCIVRYSLSGTASVLHESFHISKGHDLCANSSEEKRWTPGQSICLHAEESTVASASGSGSPEAPRERLLVKAGNTGLDPPRVRLHMRQRLMCIHLSSTEPELENSILEDRDSLRSWLQPLLQQEWLTAPLLLFATSFHSQGMPSLVPSKGP